ncbi:MAG: polysaccharide biosynthesis/export family protein [Candidatus Nealsonbacteria bacterium]|nr:polysaccharide biosynthesis/export family protein [Candidatus Nealsonbacteria bacterium]
MRLRKSSCLTVPALPIGAALVLLAVATAGCTANRYLAGDLPPEFQAPITENIEAVGLTRLSHCPTNSELIARGDVLEVTIITDYGEQTTTTTPARVSDDGTANVPLIGKVALAGLELDEAEQKIASEGITRGVFQHPHVVVTMKRKRMNRITVIGPVKEPGVYDLPRDSSTLLAALVAAGSLDEDAGYDVEIRRAASRNGAARPPGIHAPFNSPPPGSPPSGLPHGNVMQAGYEQPWPPGPAQAQARVIHVNLTTAADGGHDANLLNDGDVVVVPKRAPKPIYVMGLVERPDKYELPPNHDTLVLDAIAQAGGRTMQVADKVLIVRRVPGREEPVVIETSVRRAKADGKANIRLAPGDIVSVEETAATVVLDALRNFMRVGATLPLF